MFTVYAIVKFSIILVDMVSTQHHGLETLSPEKFRDLHNAFRKMILNGSVPNQPKAKAMPDLFRTFRNLMRDQEPKLTPVVTRLLASIVLRRLTVAREMLTREQQAGFRPGRGCVDQIFTLRQVLEQRHTYKRPTILVFLDFRGAFDSVDRSVLIETLAHQGMPQKFVNIIRSLYSQTSGRVLDNKLNENAKKWAEKCVYKHQAKINDGENLAVSSDSSENPVELWFDKHKTYNFGKLTNQTSTETDPYTQVFWEKNKALGVLSDFCETMKDGKGNPVGQAYFSVCRYSPR
ncbi:hypothetical protein T265_02092 [Opisthorchis viverrini]|uniref:SCP domain-containing protein n=1 Tax=Opisthorchis viverrini TaxID=6198 RepID=A0A075AIJ1_OPIVI|nr:hypothetical protein T265_02092 [Opisthorchis viverrini]KER31724.1 hypothetical protein T265_02092 [Opisthorchis viverrini]